MAEVAPLQLVAAMEDVAVVLDRHQVPVVGLDGRRAYPFESASAAVTVTVHLDSARCIDLVADLFDLDTGDLSESDDLYTRGGHRQPGVYLSVYGPPHKAATVAEVAS